jgi:Cu-processing system permease protein
MLLGQYSPTIMLKILKYSFFDLMRSRWSYVYFFFYLLLGLVLLFLNHDLSKAIITLMNVIIVLVPLIGTIFGIMYYYNSQEFTELLLAQPIDRKYIFLGQYLGVAFSLSLSLILGLGIPFLIYGLFKSDVIVDFLSLLIIGSFLTFIFTAIAFTIALANGDKIRGFGFAILVWLFFAIIYDGIFLLILLLLEEYPLEKVSLIGIILNPIDLSRILILLKLDISALLGYTGAIFKKFFGTSFGQWLSFTLLLFWIVFPVLRILVLSRRKDF